MNERLNTETGAKKETRSKRYTALNAFDYRNAHSKKPEGKKNSIKCRNVK